MKNIGIAENNTYQEFIDGLRGVAILMVLALHTSQFCGNGTSGVFRFHASKSYLNSGARGVQLFFMLSAFTLFSSSKNRFNTDSFPKVSFYIRRAFRILPFWWLITTFFVIKNGISLAASLPNYLMYFGFIRYRPNVETFSMGWSIFVEETFYIFLPAIFKNITGIFRAGAFLTAMLALSYVWEQLANRLQIPTGNSFIILFPFSQWFCFAAGIFIFFFKDSHFFKNHLVNSRGFLIFIDATALISIFLLITKDYRTACLPLFFIFLASIPSNTYFGYLMRRSLLKRFGTYCYSIYLFHFIILSFLEPFELRFFKAIHLDQAWLEIRFMLLFPAIALICLFVGGISFNLIEKPCVQLGKHFVKIVSNILHKLTGLDPI